VTAIHTRWLRILCVIAFYGLLVYAGQIASDWAMDRLEMDLRPSNQAMIHQMVMTAAALYIILLALPFMPGIEIGLGLMIMLGPDVCFLVYMSTVIALILAFAIGRAVSMDRIVVVFEWLGLARARDLVARIAPMPAEDRLTFLISRVPARLLSFLLRHRYIAVAVALNLPGNAFIGGGGGIALVAGTSRLFSFPAYALTVALAVSPFPLIYYLANGFR